MKKKLIIIILSIVGLIIISTSIYFIVAANKKPITYDNEKTDDKTDIVAPTMTIEENDSKTNIANALYNVGQKESFKTTTTGSSKALFFTQEIKDERIIIGSKAIVSTISIGAAVELGKQKYVDKNNDKVLIRDYETLSIEEVKWKESEPQRLTLQDYINLYGTLPFEASAYIINNDTIKTISETIKLSDNEYKIEMELDANKAAFWFKHEIVTDSQSEEEPDFEYVKLVYYLDSNINILKIDVEEKYKVVRMGFKVTATTNRCEVFEYDNIKFREEDLAYFSKY